MNTMSDQYLRLSWLQLPRANLIIAFPHISVVEPNILGFKLINLVLSFNIFLLEISFLTLRADQSKITWG